MLLFAFFESLRAHGVPVSLTEWMALLRLLHSGAVSPDLDSFYRAARTVLVKDEGYYDRFDRAFLATFRDVQAPEELLERVLEAMKREYARVFTEEEMKLLESLPFEQIMKNFQEQLEQGHFRGHEGGNRAIGRRGTSTQGADGFNPAGVRIGQSVGRHGKAVQIAEFRRFREYDRDRKLDTRNMRVALSRLRRMLPDGPPEELDIERTIDETARNAGEIELVFEPRKRNLQRILLLTDVGGSMSGYSDLVSRFFSAMKDEIRDLEHFYFHNCIYDDLYRDAARHEAVPSAEVIEKFHQKYLLVLVGDASMSPTELLYPGGAIDLYVQNRRPGLAHLQDLAGAFQKSVWLNPEPVRYWELTQSIQLIQQVFPMYPLTEDGVVDAVAHLLGRRRAA